MLLKPAEQVNRLGKLGLEGAGENWGAEEERKVREIINGTCVGIQWYLLVHE